MDALYKKLSRYNQHHLLKFYSSLDEQSKNELINAIEGIDLDRVSRIFSENVHNREHAINTIQPLPIKTIASTTTDELQRWFNKAKDAICGGEVAAFLVAGGQGSRLGFEGPKGAFDMRLPSGKSLFQLQAERLLNLSHHYGVTIPWYIMTSELNYEDTVNHFTKYDFFSYPSSEVHFFKQGMIPAFDTEGKILLQEKHQPALVPDGNGGCFAALEKSGLLASMKARGIKHIFLYGVDNALIEVCDPEFIGFYLDSGKDAAAKVVKKSYPDEKVGIFAEVNGVPGVIEYSDIDDATRLRTNADGSLVFDGGNIAVHMVSLRAIEKLSNEPLPYHTAFKKVQYIDDSGERVSPTQENAYKFEQFMFDIFSKIGALALFEVDRSAEFAPIKNAEGKDSPASARTLVLNLHTKWLRDAGVAISPDCYYEISPLISCYGENLNQHVFNEGMRDGLIYQVPK